MKEYLTSLKENGFKVFILGNGIYNEDKNGKITKTIDFSNPQMAYFEKDNMLGYVELDCYGLFRFGAPYRADKLSENGQGYNIQSNIGTPTIRNALDTLQNDVKNIPNRVSFKGGRFYTSFEDYLNNHGEFEKEFFSEF